MAMSAERHRALENARWQFTRLHRGDDAGASFAIEMLDALVRAGLATAEQREMRAGRQPINVIWLTITDIGRLALAG
jgi:hypothetical protein